MATLISVRKGDCFACRKCGTLVTWWKNRNDKAILVEVDHHPKLGLVYRTGMGNHKNFTPWHNCEARQQANSSYRELCLKQVRDEIARQYLPRFEEMAKNFTPEKTAEAEQLGQEYAAAMKAAEAKWLEENPPG